jgi:hypothetical protein
MPTITVEPDQLLEAAAQLPPAELEHFLTRLAARSRPRRTLHLSPSEAELIERINETLPPAVQERLDYLIAQRQSYALTPDEQQELIALTEQIESADARRLECLIELAALRRVTVDEVIRQLGLTPVPHD